MDLLMRDLPTPFAHLWAQSAHRNHAELRVGVRLFEHSVLFAANVLRAQADDRPVEHPPLSLGTQFQEIRGLATRLLKSGRTPAVDLVSGGLSESVATLISIRNCWAHPPAAVDDAQFWKNLRLLLKEIATVRIIMKGERSEAYYELNGIDSLFEPRSVDPPQAALAPPGSLFARAGTSMFDLQPFLRWTLGPVGENRIELLKGTKPVFRYVDPLSRDEAEMPRRRAG